MKSIAEKRNLLSVCGMLMISIFLNSCSGTKNAGRPSPGGDEAGTYLTMKDGASIFVREYVPAADFKNTIWIIAGITGINYKSEKDIIDCLGNNRNRVIVIHPRGTGYSDGKRGDESDFGRVTDDYAEIIKTDRYYSDKSRNNILYGHSMSCAFAIKTAEKINNTAGVILVNPSYKMKKAKGMSPSAKDYLKYAFYWFFAPHVPVVNMAGDPSVIKNADDRKESEAKQNDPLLVRYFSMRSMTNTNRLIRSMAKDAMRAGYPLLILYGENDVIVDKTGCDEIFAAWKNSNKKYEIIKGGAHGMSTVIRGAGVIAGWVDSI
jgi:alpha-beta hydrolase superfamily lysophospholipase